MNLKKNAKLLLIAITYVVFLTVPLIAAEKQISIASFNSLHLGWKGKNYQATANLLKNFDLIGLEEVMKEEGLILLQTELEKITKTEWKYLISTIPKGKTPQSRYKEYYAFIWQSNKVKLIKNLGFYQEKKSTDFIREPFGAIFAADNADFTFVICHSIYGKNKKVREEEATKLKLVYNYFQKINKTEQDVLIAGDFNLSAKNKAFNDLYFHNDKIKNLLPVNIKTTLGQKDWGSAYDNFFASKIYSSEIIAANSLRYDDSLKNQFPLIRKTISDHIPIYIIFDTTEDDD